MIDSSEAHDSPDRSEGNVTATKYWEKKGTRQVCGVGDQIFSFLILLFGLTMATYAWHTLHYKRRSNNGPRSAA
jgi:hypothetical protein